MPVDHVKSLKGITQSTLFCIDRCNAMAGEVTLTLCPVSVHKGSSVCVFSSSHHCPFTQRCDNVTDRLLSVRLSLCFGIGNICLRPISNCPESVQVPPTANLLYSPPGRENIAEGMYRELPSRGYFVSGKFMQACILADSWSSSKSSEMLVG